MIAKIKYGNNNYFSYIYFLCKYEYKTKVITFNPNDNKFELLEPFTNKYNNEKILYLYDYCEDGLIHKDSIKLSSYEVSDCMGYDWLINNEDLIRDIELNKEVKEEYLEIAKNLNNTINVYDWHEVKTKEDAEELLDMTGAFHDSYIRDLKGIFGRPFEPEFETKLQISFELYGTDYDILLEFVGGADIKYGLSSNLNYIYLASIILHNNLIYWVDGSDELLPIDIKDHPYICASRLRWKLIDKQKHEKSIEVAADEILDEHIKAFEELAK